MKRMKAGKRDFPSVARAFSGRANVESARMFGSDAFKVGGKVFCMQVRGRLVVKLSKGRADELIAASLAEPFDPGHGRVMREWVTIGSEAPVDWVALSEEAMTYVAAAAKR